MVTAASLHLLSRMSLVRSCGLTFHKPFGMTWPTDHPGPFECHDRSMPAYSDIVDEGYQCPHRNSKGDARTNGTLVADAYLVHVTSTMAQISSALGETADARLEPSGICCLPKSAADLGHCTSHMYKIGICHQRSPPLPQLSQVMLALTERWWQMPILYM
jgi:hypothetical protein